MTREELLASIQTADTESPYEEATNYYSNKVDTLTNNKQKKLEKLGGISGMYDADSPYSLDPYQGYNQKTGQTETKNTYRLSGDDYYLQAPELKVDGELTQDGINARIQADNYAMGVDAPNFAEGEGLDPQYYEQYRQAMDPALRERSQSGEYEVLDTGRSGYYGRKLVQAQSKEMPISQTDYLLNKGQGDKVPLDNVSNNIASGLEEYYKNADTESDGYVGELVDQAQSQGLKFYADAANALRKGSRALLGTVADEETVDKYLPINNELMFVGEKVQKVREDQALRDEIAGLSKESREEWNKAQQGIMEAAENKEYGKMAWNILTNVPRYLADSAPEMAAMFLPGGAPLVIGSRLSNQMEEFKKNNDRDMTAGEAMETALAIAGTVYAEKFIVKTGVGKAIESSKGVKGAVGKTTFAGGAESVQELAEKVQEDIYTGDVEDRRSLEAFKEAATDTEAIVGAATGGITGTALAGGAEVTKQSPKIVKTSLDKITSPLDKIAERNAKKEADELTSKIETDIAAGLEGKIENPVEAARELRIRKEEELSKIQKIDKETGALTGEYTDEFKKELQEGKTDMIDSAIEWLEEYKQEVYGSKEEVEATQNIIDGLKDTRDGIAAYQEENIQPTVDAVKENIDSQPEIEATAEEKVDMAFADMYDEKGKLTKEAEEQGWTKESVEKVKNATKTQYRIAGFGPLDGDLQVELDENVKGTLKTRQDRAKLKEGETVVDKQGVKTRDVNIDAVSDEDISGLLSADLDKIGESINKLAGAVKSTNTKLKKRVLDTLGIESVGKVGSKVIPLLDMGDKVNTSVEKALASEDTAKRVGNVFKGENKEGNLKRLLVLAMAEIDASTVTNTKELQGITAKESNFRPDEYWASRSQLVEEIGKRYETSYGLKLKGSPKKLREQRRKLGELALRVLEEGGMIETTKGEDPVRLFKLSDEAMVDDNGKRERAVNMDKAGKVELTDGRVEAYNQDVKLYADQGVRLLNEKGQIPVDRKGYKNELGDVAKRMTKLLIPSQSKEVTNEAPDNNFVTDPVKVDSKISAFEENKNTTEGSVVQTIRDIEKEPLRIKGPMATLVKEIKTLRDRNEDDLWKVFSKNDDLAKAVGWMNTDVALLEDRKLGVNNQIVEDWNNILDAFENVVDENGNPMPMYYKYQYDVNSRITLMDKVLNFQGFKDSRYMLTKEKPVEYKLGSKEEEKLVQHVLEELGVMGKKPSKEQYDEARNMLKDKQAKDGVLTQEQVDGINKYKKLADKVADFKGSELDKLKLVTNEVGSKAFKKLALVNVVADIQNAQDGAIETDFMVEYDAKASGVTNTLLSLMHIPEIRDILKSFGLKLGKNAKETEWKDAYTLLEDKVMESVDTSKMEKLRELDEVLGMDMRDLAKPVVMTWFYSAGDTSISREFRIAIAQKLVEEAEGRNTGAKDMLEKITGMRDPRKISESSEAYKKIMEYYADVAKAYSDQIDAAYPSVSEHKRQMHNWYLKLTELGMVDGEDLWQGKIPSAISYLRSGELEIQETGYIKLQKEKEVLLGTLKTLKDEATTEDVDTTLVKQMETMPNITSLLPLLRQNVDGALLLESMDKLLKGDRSNKGIMTVHDAFYGSVQELEKLKQEYDELSIKLAKGYDDAGVMAAAAKYVVKQLEKAKDEGKNVGKNQLQIARALAKNIDTQYKKNVVAKSRLGKMSISVLGVSEYEQAPAKVDSTEVKVEKKAPEKKVVAKKVEKKEENVAQAYAKKVMDTTTLYDTETTFDGNIISIAYKTPSMSEAKEVVIPENLGTEEEYYKGTTPNYVERMGYLTYEQAKDLVTSNKNKATLEDAVKEMIAESGDTTIAGFNAITFDQKNILEAVSKNVGNELIKKQRIDIMEDVVSEFRTTGKKAYGKQADIARILGVDSGNAHMASDDVNTMYKILDKLSKVENTSELQNKLDAPALAILKGNVQDGKINVDSVETFLKSMSGSREATDILDALDAIRDSRVEFIEEAEARKLAKEEFDINGFAYPKDDKVYIFVNYKKALDKNTPQSMKDLANVLFHEIEHARTLEWIEDNKDKSPAIAAVRKGVGAIKEGMEKYRGEVKSNNRLKNVVTKYDDVGELSGVEELVALYRENNIYGRKDLIKDIAKLVGEARGRTIKVSIEKIIKEVRRSLEGKEMKDLDGVDLEVAQIIAGIEHISQAKSKQDTGKIRVQKLYEQLKKECKG
jgi:hypothetical protein